MSEILISFGKLAVYTHSFLVAAAFFWYSFVVYKKGLEFRYERESLLDLAILSGALGWFGARLGYVFTHASIFAGNWVRFILIGEYPGYEYLGLVIGLILAVVVLAQRGELKLYEGLDLLGLGLPGAIAFERLGKVIAGSGTVLFFSVPVEIFQAFVFLLIFVWLWRLEGEYRTFAWYRFRKTQARPGFIFGAFLFFSGLILLLSGFWPLFSQRTLMLAGTSLLSGIVVVYRQSGRSLTHDVKLLALVSRWYTKSK